MVKLFRASFDYPSYCFNYKQEDLNVLRRSPDLFNNVKIGQGQLRLIIKHILLYHICTGGKPRNYHEIVLT